MTDAQILRAWFATTLVGATLGAIVSLVRERREA